MQGEEHTQRDALPRSHFNGRYDCPRSAFAVTVNAARDVSVV